MASSGFDSSTHTKHQAAYDKAKAAVTAMHAAGVTSAEAAAARDKADLAQVASVERDGSFTA